MHGIFLKTDSTAMKRKRGMAENDRQRIKKRGKQLYKGRNARHSPLHGGQKAQRQSQEEETEISQITATGHTMAESPANIPGSFFEI